MNNYKLIRIFYYFHASLPLESFLAPVVVIFYLNHVGVSFFQYSYFIAALFILNMVLEVPLGVVSDVIGRRKSLIGGYIVYILGLSILLYGGGVMVLIPATLLLGIGQTLSSGNLDSIGYESFSESNNKEEFRPFLGKTNSLSIGVTALAALAGGYLSDIDIKIPMVIDIIFIAIKMTAGILLLLIFWKKTVGKTVGINKIVFKNDYNSITNIVFSRKFLFYALLSVLCFSLLRTSLNLYQPILTEKGWNGTDLGLLFSLSIMVSAIISYFLSSKINYGLQPSFIILCVAASVTVSSLLFYLSDSSILFFILAFVIHQFIRIIVPPIASSGEQASIPSDFPYRTTVVSISLLIKAAFASISILITGFLVDRLHGYTDSLVYFHIFILLLMVILSISTLNDSFLKIIRVKKYAKPTG